MSQMTHRTTTKDVWDKFNRVRGHRAQGRNAVLDDSENGNQFLRMLVDVPNNLGDRNECLLPDSVRENSNDLCVEFKWDEFLRVLDTAKSDPRNE